LHAQLIRYYTSVPGNYKAACLAQSKASFSFTAKLSIVIEEANESLFWLEFILEEKLIKKEIIILLLIKRSIMINNNIYCIKGNNSNKQKIINNK